MLGKICSNKEEIVLHALIAVCALAMAFADDRFIFFVVIAFIWSVLVLMQRQITIDPGDVLLFAGMFIFKWIY